MPGALFSRIKTWVTAEDVTYSDLNAEFDNILQNLLPLMIDDYSVNTTQMQVTTDPGEVGTESLATTLGGELARLRFILREITGEDEWYETPTSSLLGLANAIGTGLTDNRLVSGRILSTSSQPSFLVANGAARTVKVDGTPTAFIYYVNGTEYSITTDVTATSLTAAPSSNNTCLINDAVAADQYWTKHTGEEGTEIPVDTMGSEITALVGKFAAFSLNNGSSTEYFTAFVKSTTVLSKCKRGYFFDSTDAAVPRVVYTNNDTITLMKLTWVFAKSDGTLTATYTNPVWAFDEPSSPSIGDYWYDLDNDTWKVYGVGSYSSAAAVLVGVCIQDATNTVAARSFEFFANYTDANTNEVIAHSASVVRTRLQGAQTNVWGLSINNGHNVHEWDMTIDLDSGVTEAASTYYYFYLTEDGDTIISNVKPHDRRADLGGYYHTHQSWRCLGRAFNNSSSDLEQIESYFRTIDTTPVRSLIAADVSLAADRSFVFSGATHTHYLPPVASFIGKSFTYTHGGTSLTQVYTLDGYDSETINGATTYPLYTNTESVTLLGTSAGWIATAHFTETPWTDAGVMTITSSGGGVVKGTAARDNILWKRKGSEAMFRIEYRQTAGGTAGTGVYIIALPTNLTIDTTLYSISTDVTITGLATAQQQAAGHGSVGITNTAGRGMGHWQIYSTTQIIPHITISFTAYNLWGAATYPMTDAALAIAGDITLPILNWKP